MKRVLYVLVQPIDSRPPCIAEICMLRDMGIEVVLLTSGCNQPTRKQLEARDVRIRLFEMKQFPVMAIQRGINAVNYFHVFRRLFGTEWTAESVLWLGSEQTAMKMWPFVRSRHPMILNALEFYEEDWYQSRMPEIARGADILTACEPTRAKYMMDWWHLDRMPYVLRNKPYGTLPVRGPGSTPELRSAIDRLQGKKVLLYQGLISVERDLSLLAKALAAENSDYYLVLMGPDRDESLPKLRAIYDKIIYLGMFPVPLHLEITCHATVGVAFYQDNSINTRYCAPNKIYEYSGCGIPMLSNNIPGLSETVGSAGAAECVDFSDSGAVRKALEKIDADYENYRQAALRFYRDTDNTGVMEQIAADAFSRIKEDGK